MSYSDSTPAVVTTNDRLGRASSIVCNGITTTYGYNNVDQLVSESYSGGALNGLGVTNTYDAFLRRVTNNAWNGATKLVQGVYGYDSASRLRTVGDGTNTVAYAYFTDSPLVSQITFTNDGTLRITTAKQYDHLNRLQSLSTMNPQQTIINSYNYRDNSANQWEKVYLADGSIWIYEYDSLGQVKSGKHYWSDWTPVAGQQFEYAHDDIGNRTATKAGGDENGANLLGATFAPNNLNQYTNRTVPGAANIIGVANATAAVTVNNQETYRHEEYFRKELTIDNALVAQWQSVTNKAVEGTTTNSVIGSVFLPKTPEVFAYDEDGNLLADGRWNYVWDAENRLIRMESLTNAPADSKRKLTFAYNCQGRRFEVLVYSWNGSSYGLSSKRNFLYDGWNPIVALGHEKVVKESFLWGLDLSSSEQGAGGVGGLLVVNDASLGSHFAVFDGNGNVTALVSATNSAVTARYEYGPFGELVRSSGTMATENPFRYSTRYHDDASDFLYFGYRYYNPNTGRWLSLDPLEEAGSRNLYGFLSNDGINRSDYLGLVEVTWKQLEQLITDSITTTAENIFNFLQNHKLKDWQVTALNTALIPVKLSANTAVDINPKTMGWPDLVFAWFFERGPENYPFIDGDRTTEDLKEHYGVQEARELARLDCWSGKYKTSHEWPYGRKEFWRSIVEVDTVAEFLGSYTIKVESEPGCCYFKFSVANNSTWESATRFRKAEDGKGVHRGIIQNRRRNEPGIRLGGNMSQTWKWTETIIYE